MQLVVEILSMSMVYIPATVLLPTPPLPLATAITCLTFGIDRFFMGELDRLGISGAGPGRLGIPYR